jgi:hypothetical protein
MSAPAGIVYGSRDLGLKGLGRSKVVIAVDYCSNETTIELLLIFRMREPNVNLPARYTTATCRRFENRLLLTVIDSPVANQIFGQPMRSDLLLTTVYRGSDHIIEHMDQGINVKGLFDKPVIGGL